MPLKKTLQFLRPVEIVFSIYLLLTSLFIIIFYSKIQNAHFHLLFRMGLFGFIYFIIKWDLNNQSKIADAIRSFYILAILGFIYAETDAFNNVFFNNLDPWFVNLEQIIFKSQPSIEFYLAFPQKWFNELMNFAYFSYYPLIFIFCLWVYLKEKQLFNKIIFLICTSFLMYYIVFILLPVTGPQFYFNAPFNHNPPAYFFSKVMLTINCIAERPTAAFPSSHVGVVFILWILCFKHARKLLIFYIPIGILLFFSTVYIKAHYLIDVFAGIITAPLFYWFSNLIFKKIVNVKL
jgi:membrane-associated phospholipid phosphatase